MTEPSHIDRMDAGLITAGLFLFIGCIALGIATSTLWPIVFPIAIAAFIGAFFLVCAGIARILAWVRR